MCIPEGRNLWLGVRGCHLKIQPTTTCGCPDSHSILKVKKLSLREVEQLDHIESSLIPKLS